MIHRKDNILPCSISSTLYLRHRSIPLVLLIRIWNVCSIVFWRQVTIKVYTLWCLANFRQNYVYLSGNIQAVKPIMKKVLIKLGLITSTTKNTLLDRGVDKNLLTGLPQNHPDNVSCLYWLYPVLNEVKLSQLFRDTLMLLYRDLR